MTRRPIPNPLAVLCGLLLFTASARSIAQPPPAAISAFNSYISVVEARLGRQHSSPATLLASVDTVRLHGGDLVVEELSPAAGASLPGALLHHWRGSAFIPGGTAADFERLMRNIERYPQCFAPDVLQAKVLSGQGDRIQALLRVRQHHVLTVVLDTTYDIAFRQLDPFNGYTTSRSTNIVEIDSPGMPTEHPLSPTQEHGFLWRTNTYWSYQERDDGLYIQVESVSLTRSIPASLGWIVGPYLESIPRESLQFTLRAAANALKKTDSQRPRADH